MNKETLRMQMLAGIITESEYAAKLNESSSEEEKKILSILSQKINGSKLNKDVDGTTYVDFEKDGESYKLHLDPNGDLVISYWDPSSGEGKDIFHDEHYADKWDLDAKNYDDLDFSAILGKIQSL
jgi:hypothetical protein